MDLEDMILFSEFIKQASDLLVGKQINTHRKYTQRHGRRIKHKYKAIEPGLAYYYPALGAMLLKTFRLFRHAN